MAVMGYDRLIEEAEGNLSEYEERLQESFRFYKEKGIKISPHDLEITDYTVSRLYFNREGSLETQLEEEQQRRKAALLFFKTDRTQIIELYARMTTLNTELKSEKERGVSLQMSLNGERTLRALAERKLRQEKTKTVAMETELKFLQMKLENERTQNMCLQRYLTARNMSIELRKPDVLTGSNLINNQQISQCSFDNTKVLKTVVEEPPLKKRGRCVTCGRAKNINTTIRCGSCNFVCKKHVNIMYLCEKCKDVAISDSQ